MICRLRRLCRVGGTALLLLAGAAAAEPALDLEQVLAASARHYPKILQAIEMKRGRDARVLSADGAFDWKVTQDSLFWANGFYSGKSVDSKVVRPLEALGADVFAGYRVTDGSFPIYQDELITQDGGEFNFGIMFSLLRDRDFDERRFRLRATRLERNEAELNLMLTRVMVQRDAMKSYWNWVAAGQSLAVYRELLDLALAHNQALEKRVAEGDLAEIFLVESRQNILKREALVTRQERDFIAAGIKLGLFYRDAEGRPEEVVPVQLPEGFPSIDPAVTRTLQADIASLNERQYQLGILDRRIEVERTRVRLGENALLPNLDVGVKASQDFGRGSITRDEFDIIFEVRFEVPLERRQARGELAAARARLSELGFERRLLEDQLTAEMRRLAQFVDTAIRYAEITEQEFQQAEKLARAEWVRFQEGASDFFLLNLREERTAEAKIRNIDAILDYFLAVADYYAVTVDTTSLGIE